MEPRPPTELTPLLRLLLITDNSAVDSQTADHLLLRIQTALDTGLPAVMLREKNAPGHILFHMARRLRDMTHRAKAALIINDRVDVAIASRADAVHLGWCSMPLPVVRSLIPPQMRIGVSTHSITEIQNALDADYVTFGPVFPTPSKEGLVPVTGLDGLRDAVEQFPKLPIIGLGGITSDNAPSVLRSGAAGTALIRAILQSPHIHQATRQFLQKK